MFEKILSSYLKPVTNWEKSLISGVWQCFDLVIELAINYFRKNVGYLFAKRD